MKMFGIDFVPLNEPLKSRLEAVAAGTFFILLVGLIPIGTVMTVYILLFTKYWLIFTIYLFWIWVIDRKVPEEGARTSEWVRSWLLFKYVKNYFPITLKVVPGFQLDPKRNYLSCSFPHGFMPFGIMITFLTNAVEECKLWFPEHSVHGTTLSINYYIPIYREFLLALGICSATPKSISWLLSHPGGGKVAGIIVGGAAEAHFCHEGNYRLILKNRKGFAKIALKNGSPIMPSFSFGQNRNFKQVVLQEGSMFRRFQDMMKKITGIAFLAVYGRGLFQYNFGLIPFQRPINVVVGAPIDVPKIDEPTQEDIDRVHAQFIEKLTEIFEEYKYEYEENPESCSLIIS